MTADSGLALVSAILVLAFLSLVGAALLSTTSVEIRIVENYQSAVRLKYLAESGIQDARARLQVAGDSLATQLLRAAGPDQRIETSNDIDVLIRSDDQPILPADPGRRAAGEAEPVPSGEPAAALHVFLRNDIADGPASSVDANGVVTLVSIARMDERHHRTEVDLTRQEPRAVSALTLVGPASVTGLGTDSLLRIEGRDRCGGEALHAVGVSGAEDLTTILSQIPQSEVTRYPGSAPVPDVLDVTALLPAYVQTPSGLERLVRDLDANATDFFRTEEAPTRVASLGSPEDPRVVVVSDDAILERGVGYGILVVRGAADIEDGFVWNGLVLIIGRGQLAWRGEGTVYGAVLVARTLSESPSGASSVLGELGQTTVEFAQGRGGIYFDSCMLAEAHDLLPVLPIAIRSY